MTIKDICTLVWVVVGVIAYTVSTALAIKRKKSLGMTNEEYDTFLMTEFERVLGYIVKANSKYNSVFKEGVKAGEFKLKDVLDLIKEDCGVACAVFDKTFWTNIINNIVECMNTEKAVQSTGQSDKIKIQGVNVEV